MILVAIAFFAILPGTNAQRSQDIDSKLYANSNLAAQTPQEKNMFMQYAAPIFNSVIKASRFMLDATNPTKTVASGAYLITEQCKKIQFKFGMILNRDVESLSNTRLFSFIDEWWNTKYKYGGTGRNGIDCSAFTGLLMSTVFSSTLPRTAREQYKVCNKVSKDKLVEGDLVFFNTTGGVSHVGFYLGGGYFVHASVSQGITINNLDETYYRSRFIGGGRLASGSQLASK